MSSSLSSAEIDRYREQGFLSPLDGLPGEDARRIGAEVAAFAARHDVDPALVLRNKAHLKMPSLDAVIRDARLLDAVEGVLGPDILCWGSSFFIKRPGGKATVGWHQDSYYWDITPGDVCVAWLAVQPSTLENGAMQVIPGSHTAPAHHHGASPEGSSNMLFSYEEIVDGVEESRAVPCLLEAGQFSLHNMAIVHGSDPNRSSGLRMGFSITYIAPHCVHTGRRTTATLVRGENRQGHFGEDVHAEQEMDPQVLAFIDGQFGSALPVAELDKRPDQHFYRNSASRAA